ncbi:alkylhydroperoxidase family enzyme [Streptomyces achromogenes]|nr:alkylhydroperoxidase family enzyme [Streptomyces achromogenes]
MREHLSEPSPGAVSFHEQLTSPTSTDGTTHAEAITHAPHAAQLSPRSASAARHYDEDQLSDLVMLIALINATNRMGVIVRQRGGDYQPDMFADTAH